MHETKPSTSHLPHRLALVLVGATFPLIWVGGLVTTTGAGMAVPDWPNTYGYNLFLYPWQTWLFGPWDLFIEHGHRLLGALVGMLSIALAAAVWFCDRRTWMRWLAVAAVVAVIGQGVLGGMRVRWDEPRLAQLHGCAGPAFFALTVALAVLTSRRWLSVEPPAMHPRAAALHRLAILTTLLALGQIVLGSMVRHVSFAAGPWSFHGAVMFHLLVAALLSASVAALVVHVVRRHRAERSLVRPAFGLAGLVVLQVVLGGATWVVKYGWPAALGGYGWAARFTIPAQSLTQTSIVTLHVAAGSLILATSLVIVLRGLRLRRAEPRPLAGRATFAGAAQ